MISYKLAKLGRAEGGGGGQRGYNKGSIKNLMYVSLFKTIKMLF